MHWIRRHTVWRLLQPRLTAGLALLAYLSASFGFPLPVPAGKDHSQRYPCENHPCGCRCAEDCWRHCCCTTPEERWAWARANGVEPPPYAERPKSDGGKHDQARIEPHHACCCEHEDDGDSSIGDDEDTPAAETDSPRNPTGSVKWVLGIVSQKCRGGSTLWSSSGAALPPPPAVTWTPGLIPVGCLLCTINTHIPIALIPSDPPPRSSQ
jgi:hypothetical protein